MILIANGNNQSQIATAYSTCARVSNIIGTTQAMLHAWLYARQNNSIRYVGRKPHVRFTTEEVWRIDQERKMPQFKDFYKTT